VGFNNKDIQAILQNTTEFYNISIVLYNSTIIIKYFCSIPTLKVGEDFSFVHFTFAHRSSPTVFHSLSFPHDFLMFSDTAILIF
jgi:hypothetical protein